MNSQPHQALSQPLTAAPNPSRYKPDLQDRAAASHKPIVLNRKWGWKMLV